MHQPAAGSGTVAAPRAAPSSSRMVASYLTDVEQLLEEQHWDAALSEAVDLPRIAVALTDPTLHSSGEQQKSWCEQWIQPSGDAAESQGLDYERVRRAVCERLAHEEAAAPKSVPARALRRLRLRRHVRTAPRGYSPEHSSPPDPQTSEMAQICTALVDAARRWYARSACHDTTVQANLARLAVLR
jgi:glutamine synthetase adenylyltransferase